MHRFVGVTLRLMGFWSACVLLAGCQSKTETYQGNRPTRAPTKQQMQQMERETAKAVAPADPQMKAVLDELKALEPKPIATLSADDAREQPTPADAVRRLLKKQDRSTDPEPVADVDNRKIEVRDQKIPIRVYTPKGKGPFPVIVYYHGGGWVMATNDVYDSSARALTNAAQAVLISVEYRKAPEHRFPTAHEDAYAAYVWALEHAQKINGDPGRVAVAGESAGGNLAGRRRHDGERTRPKAAGPPTFDLSGSRGRFRRHRPIRKMRMPSRSTKP